MTEKPGILVLAARIEEVELARLVDLYFRDMVKYVPKHASTAERLSSTTGCTNKRAPARRDGRVQVIPALG